MKLKAEFQNGQCKLYMIPEGEWEQQLIGAVAGNAGDLESAVEYKPQGHFSYHKAEAVCIILSPRELKQAEPPTYGPAQEAGIFHPPR